MELTTEQQKAIQEILRHYREEAGAIVAEHRLKVTQILEDLDRQKAEELAKLIQTKIPFDKGGGTQEHLLVKGG